jgi:heme-degrading monooxygenase HmoA
MATIVQNRIMLGEILLARLHVPTASIEEFWQATKDMKSLVRVIPGYLGLSVWSDAKDPDSYLLVLEARDEQTAQVAMKSFIESPTFDRLQNEVEGTSSNRWVKVKQSDGPLVSEMPVGSYLSASLRNAEPGRAYDLEKDYDMVFENLNFIEGFKGFAYGPSNNIDEQLIGLAWWTDIEAYRASLPPQTFYDIRLFRRVSDAEMHNAPF